jgi:PAS domain S-box-containing protein
MNMRAIDKTHEGGFPYGGGTMGALIRALDWSRTSLGPLSDWPPHLKATIDLMLPAKAEIVLFWGPDFIALYNDAYAPTIGHKHPRALGRPARENWEELWDDLEPLLRRVLETGETVFAKDRPFYIERRGYPENVYFDISYSAVRDGHGAIGGVLCIVSETTERVVAQQKLAQAQERLTQALNASGMVGTFDWHVQTDKFYSDARFAGMFSVDPARAVEGAPLAEYAAGIHPDDVERVSAAMKGTVATGTSYHQEYRLRQKDGTVRWVDVRGECLYDDGRTPIRFVGVVIDITKQKEAQDHERLLHRETNHRLKNLFAMLDALVSLSAKSARTPAEFASALRGRFNALLRAKGLIRPGIIDPEEARRERATVAAIVQTILQPYDDGSGRFVISGPDVSVGRDAVTGLALALHESATNAVKYGALSEPDGTVRVKWEVLGGDFHLEWQERGGPPILAPPTTRGFGSVLTGRSITVQLAGKVEYDWGKSSLNLKITIPVERLGI